jgi:hypothetical protein
MIAMPPSQVRVELSRKLKRLMVKKTLMAIEAG